MTTQDLYNLIEDVIKVHPDANDATKLQGVRHRLLLKTLVDYVVSVAGGDGDFPFDWTTPSNAFGGYSNAETTFKSGMVKFLHRDTPPTISSFYADSSVRERGADTAVTLQYAVTAGTYAIKQITVADTIITNPTSLTGVENTGTAANEDTYFTISAKDTNGTSASATLLVSYQDKRVAFTSSQDLRTATEADVSTAVRGAGGELSTDRNVAGVVQCTNSRVYVAYPLDFGNATKIVLNDFEDNSFTNRVFTHTNASGFTSRYILCISENNLFGANKIAIY